MRTITYLSIFVTLHLLGSHSVEPQLPLTLRAAASGSAASPPIWVSSRAAFDTEGKLRPEMFEPPFRQILEDNQRRNSSGCITALGAPVIEVPSRDESLDDLVFHARTIIAARVTSSDTGFYNGTPGTLFSLDLIDVPKAQGRFAPTETQPKLFVADATLVTARGTICSREPMR